MSIEHWSPAAELMDFMQTTQELGNQLAGNIANGRKFFGEEWALGQLKMLNDSSEANRDAVASACEFLHGQNILPLVQYDDTLGKWLGVSVTPNNLYSLHTSHQGAPRALKLGSAVLVDATPAPIAQSGINVLRRIKPGHPILTLGSSLFFMPSPKGTII